jgi:hypothetical protein
MQQIFDPYYVKPNLALPKQSCASAWNFHLEFYKKNFWGFPGIPQTRYTPSFFIFYFIFYEMRMHNAVVKRMP